MGLFTEEESWAPQQPLQQPSGSVGPEVPFPQPPHPDQVDQGWGNEWQEWNNGVHYAPGQLFPQVTYLTEVVETLQHQMFPQSFGEKVEELLSQSSGIKELANFQIDGQILPLAALMKSWIKEAVAP